MPLSYDQFQNIRKTNPDLYDKRILPQLDYFEGVLAEALNTLNRTIPRDAAHIADVEAMRKAIHDFAHPGRFTWASTTAANLATVCTLQDFLEKDDGRNYKLVKQTMDAHNAYLKNGKSEEKQEPSTADLLRELNEELSGKAQNKPQAKEQEPFEELTQLKNRLSAEDQGKNLHEHLTELNNFFGLDYDKRLAEYYRQERREQFRQKLAQNRDRFRTQTAKQMRFLEEVLKDAAEDIDPKDLRVSHFAPQMKDMANAIHTLRMSADIYTEDKKVEEAIETLRDLPRLLTDYNDFVAKKLHDTVKDNPELKTRNLPALDGSRSKVVLDHFADIDEFIGLNFRTKMKDQIFDEYAQLAEERTLNDQKQEEEAVRRDQEADKLEEQEAREFAERQNQRQQQQNGERKQQEEEEAREAAEQRKNYRINGGTYSMPPNLFNDLDVTAMLVNSAKENGPQYQALVKFTNALGETLRQWDAFFEGNYASRLASGMRDLPENAEPEVRDKAIDEALSAVKTEDKSAFLRAQLGDDYPARMDAEIARLGENATPKKATDNLYRSLLTRQLRDQLRKQTHGKLDIDNAISAAPMQLAQAKRDGMNEEQLAEFNKGKARFRDGIIADRIKRTLLDAYREGDAYIAFLNDQFPDPESREAYYRAHSHEPALRDYYDINKRDEALYEFRMNELVDEALHDEEKWNELNRLFERIATPDSLKDFDRKKILEGCLEKAEPEAEEEATQLDKDAESLAMRALAKSFSREEIEAQADKTLGFQANEDELLYNWAREQKQQEIRAQVEQERAEIFPDVAAIGIDKLRAMHREAEQVVQPLSELVPAEEAQEEQEFNYLQALADDKELREEDRRELENAYDRYQKELQENNGQPKPQNPPDLAGLSPIDQRILKERYRNEQHWRRKVILDMEDRREKARQERLDAIEQEKNQRINQDNKFLDVSHSFARLRHALVTAHRAGQALGADNTQAGKDLKQAAEELDLGWTIPELEKGKKLQREQFKYKLEDLDQKQQQMRENREPGAPADPLDFNIVGGPLKQEAAEEEEAEEDLNYSFVDNDFFKEEIGKELPGKELWADKQWGPYIFSQEYKDLKKQKEQEELNRLLGEEQENQAGEEQENQVGGEQEIEAGQENLEEIQENVNPLQNAGEENQEQQEHLQENPAENQQLAAEDPQNGPQPEPQAQPAAQGPTHSASWWIKQLRRPENLYEVNEGQKKLKASQIARIMAIRSMAESVRHSKDKLLEKQLTEQDIKRGTANLLENNKPFQKFILELEQKPALLREAATAVGKGHGGGLDDMYSRYLAQQAKPGELLYTPENKRWAPTASQRIEALQADLPKAKNRYEQRKYLAEIIAARQLVGAKHSHTSADKRLYNKLDDPEKLAARTKDVETCLTMMDPEKVDNLFRQASSGHGGAMMEGYKKLNTVQAHLNEIRTKQAAQNPDRKIDPAMALSLAMVANANPDKQVEATNALRSAEQLRKLPGYKEFAEDPQNQQALWNGQLMQLNDKINSLQNNENQHENAPEPGNQVIAVEADHRQSNLQQAGPNLNNNN